MKATIRGTVYDTDTAVKLGSGQSRQTDNMTDAEYWTATLYKTPRAGQYFLAGWGGPYSMFGERTSDGWWRGSERIIPLQREDAYDFARDYLPQDVVAVEFGDLPENA